MTDGNHTELFGICGNHCFVPVSPKTDTDAVEARVDALEEGTVKTTGNQSISGGKNFTGNITIGENADAILQFRTPHDGYNPQTWGRYGRILFRGNPYDITKLPVEIIGSGSNNTTGLTITAKHFDDNGTEDASALLAVYANTNASYVRASSPPSNSTGNQIITAERLNSWPSVVHTVGNETISGTKKFNNPMVRNIPVDYDSFPSSFASNVGVSFNDSNDKVVGQVVHEVENAYKRTGLVARGKVDGNNLISGIFAMINVNGSTYGLCGTTPNWAVNGEIITANALNSWSSVVHTVGNETIAGNKTFNNNITIVNNLPSLALKTNKSSISNPDATDSDIGINLLDSSGQKPLAMFTRIYPNGNVQSFLRNRCRNQNDTSNIDSMITLISTRDGTAYATAPATPSNADGNEIATAGWVNDRIEAVVPITKHTMNINSLDDLVDALEIMKGGAIGSICFKSVFTDNTEHCCVSVNGYLDERTNDYRFVASGFSRYGSSNNMFSVTNVSLHKIYGNVQVQGYYNGEIAGGSVGSTETVSGKLTYM